MEQNRPYYAFFYPPRFTYSSSLFPISNARYITYLEKEERTSAKHPKYLIEENGSKDKRLAWFKANMTP